MRAPTWSPRYSFAKTALATLLQKVGVAAAPVQDLRELALDPHLRSRGFLEKVRHPLIGNRLWTRAVPGHIEGFDLSIPRASPMLGEHNEEVLGGLLGLSEEELSELARDRIIGRRPVAPAATEAIDLDRLGAYPGLREYDPDYRQRLALDDN